MSQLNERQRIFARTLVLEGKSQQEAAIIAGYSERSAPAISSQLVKHPKVAAEIERLRGQSETRLAVSAAISRDYVENALLSIVEASDSTARDKIAALKLLSDIEGYAAPRQSERVTTHFALPALPDGVTVEDLRRIAYPPTKRPRRIALDVVSQADGGGGRKWGALVRNRYHASHSQFCAHHAIALTTGSPPPHFHSTIGRYHHPLQFF